MGSQKKNIDELIKNRLQNEKPVFNSAHWDKMASLLDKQFVTPSASSSAVTGLSSVVKILIVSVSISLPVLLYVLIGSDLFQKEKIVTENIIDKSPAILMKDSTFIVENSPSVKSEFLLINKINQLKNSQEIEINVTRSKKTEPMPVVIEKDEISTQNDLHLSVKSQANQVDKSQAKIDNKTNNEDELFIENNSLLKPVDVNLNSYTGNTEDKVKSITVEITGKKNASKQNENKSEYQIKNDTLVIQESENSIIPLRKYNGLYAFLGLNYANTFSNDKNVNTDRELSPIVGIGFEKLLKNNKLSLLFEVLYSKSSGHSMSKSSIKTSYFLNEEIIITTVNTNELDLLRVPVIFKYQLSNKHSLLAGVFGSYLINSESDLAESIQNPTFKSVKTSVVKGYRDGFKDFSYGFTLGYSFRLAKKLDLGFRFNYSPDDISIDSYYLGSGKDRLTELQFNILWKLY